MVRALEAGDFILPGQAWALKSLQRQESWCENLKILRDTGYSFLRFSGLPGNTAREKNAPGNHRSLLPFWLGKYFSLPSGGPSIIASMSWDFGEEKPGKSLFLGSFSSCSANSRPEHTKVWSHEMEKCRVTERAWSNPRSSEGNGFWRTRWCLSLGAVLVAAPIGSNFIPDQGRKMKLLDCSILWKFMKNIGVPQCVLSSRWQGIEKDTPPAQSTVASEYNVPASSPHLTTSRALKEEKAAVAQLNREVLLASGE